MEAISPKLSPADLRQMSSLALAYIGDAVYELLVRTRLCADGGQTAGAMHNEAIRRVSAHSQTEASARILPLLDEDERGVFMRGRNTHSKSLPKNAHSVEHHTATGLEALFGWLYLSGNMARMTELFDICFSEDV